MSKDKALKIAQLHAQIADALGKASGTDEIILQVLSVIAEELEWSHATFWGLEKQKLVPKISWSDPSFKDKEIISYNEEKGILLNEGLPGQVAKLRETMWLEDIELAENFPRKKVMVRAGIKSGLAIPIEVGEEIFGVMEFFTDKRQAYDEVLAITLRSFGSQLGHLLRRSFFIRDLEEATAFGHAILDASLDSVISMDHEGRIIEWNESAAKTFGYSRERALGQELASLIIPPRLRDQHRNGLAHYLATGEGPVLGKRVELPALRPDGSEFLAEIAISVVNLEGPPKFTAYLRDITAQKEVEKRLASSEELFRGLFEHNPLSCQVLDSRGVTTRINAAWLRLWNVTEEEAQEHIFKTEYNVFEDPLLKAKGIIPFIEKAYSGEMAKVPAFCYDPSEAGRPGRERWLEAYLSPIKDENGRVLKVVIVHDDITDKIDAQKEVEYAKEQFQAVFFNAPLAMSFRNAKSEYIMLNQAYSDFFGYSEKELKQKSYRDLTHPEDLDKDKEPLQKLLAEEIPSFKQEKRYVHKSGKTIWGILNASLISDPASQEKYILVAVQDISERKAIEVERERGLEMQKFLGRATYILGASLDYKETLQKVADLAIEKLCDWCAVDLVQPDGSITIAAAAHHGEELKQIVLDMRKKYPVDPERDAGIPDVIRTGKAILWPEISQDLLIKVARNEEHLHLLKTLSFESAICVPLVAREKIIGALTLISSQKERKFNEKDLLEAEELGRRAGTAVDNAHLYQQAQEAIAARDSFLSVASHELKTPVSSILLQLEMINMVLEDQLPLEEMIKKVRDISSSSLKQLGRLVTLIEDLLDVSRIQAQKLSFEVETFNLKEYMEDIFGRYSKNLKEANCPLSMEIEPDLLVSWDAFRFEQVMVNLISNAVKYAPNAEIRVEAFQSQNMVNIRFQDRGPGISMEKIGQIFKRFERATSSRSISGLGLGLFIVKTIVEAHHGSIEVESGPEKGTAFIMTIPARPGLD